MSKSGGFTDVNLLTGFLGSGKTTLLRRLLQDPALADTAVLINEFGEVGLDHHLLERIDETMVLLQSGCLCCTIRGELSDAIRDIHSKRERGLVPDFDRLVIESTGLADPFPILSTIKADPVLRHHFKPANVITTVDAMNVTGQLATYQETNRQIAIADRLVITKSDLCEGGQEARVRAGLRTLNPDAPITSVAEPDFDPVGLLALREGSRADGFHSASGFYCEESEPSAHGGAVGTRIKSFVLTVDRPIDWSAFGVWLTMLLNRHGEKILRVKGILNIAGEEAPVAIHGVQHLVHPPVHMSAWPSAERASRVVFIVDGLDIDLIRRSFNAFVGLDGAGGERMAAGRGEASRRSADAPLAVS